MFIRVEGRHDLDRSLERGMTTRPREVRLRDVPAFHVSRPIVRGTGHGHLRAVVALVDPHLLDELAVRAFLITERLMMPWYGRRRRHALPGDGRRRRRRRLSSLEVDVHPQIGSRAGRVLDTPSVLAARRFRAHGARSGLHGDVGAHPIIFDYVFGRRGAIEQRAVAGEDPLCMPEAARRWLRVAEAAVLAGVVGARS